MVTTSTTQSALASLWYCRIYGLERGPITWEMLQDLAEAGDLKPSDPVRRADSDRWVIASQARCADSFPPSAPPPPRADPEVSHRLAAALAADAFSAHAPARAFRRTKPAEVLPQQATDAATFADREEALPMQPDHCLTDVAIDPAPRLPEILLAAPKVTAEQVEPADDSAELEPVPATTVTVANRVAATATEDASHTAQELAATPLRLPAAAVAKAVREARQTNPGGLALLALGLALIGLFKLALPLGMLSLYLGWRSAADMRRRPNGAGMAVAAGALIVGCVDVGVSLYTIVNRL